MLFRSQKTDSNKVTYYNDPFKYEFSLKANSTIETLAIAQSLEKNDFTKRPLFYANAGKATLTLSNNILINNREEIFFSNLNSSTYKNFADYDKLLTAFNLKTYKVKQRGYDDVTLGELSNMIEKVTTPAINITGSILAEVDKATGGAVIDALHNLPNTNNSSSTNASTSNSIIKIEIAKGNYCGSSSKSNLSYKFYTYKDDKLLKPPNKLVDIFSIISKDKNNLWWTGCVGEISAGELGTFKTFEEATKAYYASRYKESYGSGVFKFVYK